MNQSVNTLPFANLTGLSRFQKILLITDGTVTKLLEHYVDETIIVHKLHETIQRGVNTFPTTYPSSIKTPLDVLRREICLQGELTGKNWIYAESTIFIDHLSADFRYDLLESNLPIGKLWIKYRLETYKNILSTQQEKAQTLAPYFSIEPQDSMISRTYSVSSKQKIIMMITEKFPLAFFRD
jgi:chorismate-pyruvate lyase